MRRDPMVVCSAAVALAAALAGCHDLPDPRTCGNGITEEVNGEACDDGPTGSEACTPSCELLCGFCPGAEFQCGADGFCRAPSGRFADVSDALPFNVGDRPTTGDVDNDGLPDLVGTSTTNIYVRLANPSGTPLGELVVQDAPSSDAPPVIFDPRPTTKSEIRSELLVAIPTEGIALLQSDDESFVPEPELPIEVPGVSAIGLVVRDPDPIARLGDVVVAVERASSTPPDIRVIRVRVLAPDRVAVAVPELLLPSCTGTVAGSWHLVDIEPAADRRSFVLVIQRDGAGLQPWHVCRYTQAAGAWGVSQHAFPPEPALREGVLANLDEADTCLELALRSDGRFLAIDAAGATCGFAASATDLRVAGAPRPLLAAGPIVDGGVDELVLADGVHQRCTGIDDCGPTAPGTFVAAASPTSQPWTAAVVVDLNGDDDVDVVAGRAMPNLDIVRGGASPNVYSVGSSGGVRSLVAGDFDGDRLGDVAISEIGPMGDPLFVLFGTREATVASPRAMSGPRGLGSGAGVLLLDRFTAMNWLPSSRGADGIDDLAVVQPGNQVRAGFVLGDASRLMTTPRLPPTAVKRTTLAGVAAGTFRGPDAELLAFTGPQALFYNVSNLGSARWTAPISSGPMLQNPVAALRTGPPPGRGVARMVEEAAGQPVEDHFYVFSVTGGLVDTQNVFQRVCDARTSGLSIRELRGVDVDGDGDGVDEVVALTEGIRGANPMSGPSTRKVEVFDAADCRPVTPPALEGCVDVVRVGRDLVALCRTTANTAMGPARGVFVIPDGTQERVPMKEFPVGDARFLTASDFNGDGILDVAITLHRVDEVVIHYLRQCPAHDTRNCPLPLQSGRP